MTIPDIAPHPALGTRSPQGCTGTCGLVDSEFLKDRGAGLVQARATPRECSAYLVLRTGTALPHRPAGPFHFAPRIGTHNFPQLF